MFFEGMRVPAQFQEFMRLVFLPMSWSLCSACRHTVRFILLYTAFMPIVLWRNLRWGTFIVAPVIAFALAGVHLHESGGHQLCGILPFSLCSSTCCVVHSQAIHIQVFRHYIHAKTKRCTYSDTTDSSPLSFTEHRPLCT